MFVTLCRHTYRRKFNGFKTRLQALRNLGWLPPLERTELLLLKFAHRAIHTNTWPEYLPLPLHDPKGNVRSSDTLQIAIPMDKQTFQDLAAKLFYRLPANVRSYNDFHRFNQLVTYVLKKGNGSDYQKCKCSFLVNIFLHNI